MVTPDVWLSRGRAEGSRPPTRGGVARLSTAAFASMDDAHYGFVRWCEAGTHHWRGDGAWWQPRHGAELGGGRAPGRRRTRGSVVAWTGRQSSRHRPGGAGVIGLGTAVDSPEGATVVIADRAMKAGLRPRAPAGRSLRAVARTMAYVTRPVILRWTPSHGFGRIDLLATMRRDLVKPITDYTDADGIRLRHQRAFPFFTMRAIAPHEGSGRVHYRLNRHDPDRDAVFEPV